MKITADILFIIYICSVFYLVFFPLPTFVSISHEYNAQLVPFRFVYDIYTERSFRSVMQVVCNVIMTIPFGIYLRYRFGMSKKGILTTSFLFSLFIELGQLTGLFFIFNGSYRLFDVDDLMLNTLGGFLGFSIFTMLESKIEMILALNYWHFPQHIQNSSCPHIF